MKISLIAPLIALLLTGCVGAVVVPKFHQKPENGKVVLKSKNTSFIHKGTTTATEVFNTLGTDYSYGLYQRAVAYTWEIPTWEGATFNTWIWLWWDDKGFVRCFRGEEFYCSKWRAFFIAFDTNNVVIATDTKHLSGNKCLHEQLEKWATKHHASTNEYHAFPPNNL